MVNNVAAKAQTKEAGNLNVDVLAEIGADEGPTAGNFNLFGASDDPDPSHNTSSLDHAAARPPNSQLQGTTAYQTDETFTIDVTFDQGGGPQLYRGTVPASEMVADNTYRFSLTRVP